MTIVGALTSRPGGPAIRAGDRWPPGNPTAGTLHQLLSDEERAQLATIVRFKKDERIYSQGEPADAIFNVVSGVVNAREPYDREHINAFFYPRDPVGLSDEDHYLNSATAVTPVTAYALPTPALRRQLTNDAALEFHVIAKLCHELRQGQRHALLLAPRQALAKLAMFLQLQDHLQRTSKQPPTEIYLPMDRKDIAEFVGMWLAAVSRGFRILTTRRIISVRDRRHVKIVDREALDRLTDEANHHPFRERGTKHSADTASPFA